MKNRSSVFLSVHLRRDRDTLMLRQKNHKAVMEQSHQVNSVHVVILSLSSENQPQSLVWDSINHLVPYESLRLRILW